MTHPPSGPSTPPPPSGPGKEESIERELADRDRGFSLPQRRPFSIGVGAVEDENAA